MRVLRPATKTTVSALLHFIVTVPVAINISTPLITFWKKLKFSFTQELGSGAISTKVAALTMVLLMDLVNINRLSRYGDGGRNRKGVAGEADAEEEKGDYCDELHDWLLKIICFVV